MSIFILLLQVMAAKLATDLKPDTGRARELCLITNGGEYGGYRQDILTENLTERELAFLTCDLCQGVMREACLSSNGEQFCFSCQKENTGKRRMMKQTNPNLHVRKTVSLLKCACPLLDRGCQWIGKLEDCEKHLDGCTHVYEVCVLQCGTVLSRHNHASHRKNECVYRIAKCKHCKFGFQFRNLDRHFGKCPKLEVFCDLKCGAFLCREGMAHHLKQECGLVVEMCKLDCGAGLTRDNLRIHMTDTCVQRLIACEHCLKDFKFCNLADHHGECPKMNIPCDLCCTVMYRENMTSHVEQYCPEKEVECLFVKYNCKVKIQRKNLTQHLDEKRTDHLELKLYAMELKLIAMEEIMMKQNETIEKQDMKISDQNQEIKEIFQQLTNLEEESNHSCMETESEDNSYSSGEDYLCDSDD